MKNKKGISLIVLSITILVMAILAATAIIALEDSGIIGRSKNTTAKQNEKQEYTRLQVIKNGMLTDNLGEITVDEYISELQNQGIIEGTVTTDSYGNKVATTASGLQVYIRQDGGSNLKVDFEQIYPTLGELITVANYGQTIDYTVTVGGRTYNNWKIYYHNKDYVYIMSTNYVEEILLDKRTPVSSLTAAELELYEKFRVGNFPKYTLKDVADGVPAYGCQAVAQLIKDYANFANTAVYGSNVVGAIGGPTIELLVAGWNAKGFEPQMKLSLNEYGYLINGKDAPDIAGDGLYIIDGGYAWLASPSAETYRYAIFAGEGTFNNDNTGSASRVYPVVCLRTSTPVTLGTTTDFSLVKNK